EEELKALISEYPIVDFEMLPNCIQELQGELQKIVSNHDYVLIL
ncbi:539_t:CDS:1, partial [Racocetra fulgida]